MNKKTNTVNLSTVDLLGLIAAGIYMQSVLTVAHHTSHWVHDGSSRIVESPSVIFLAIALLLAGYSWYKKKSPSTLAVITLTILITSSIFWLSGLRTNFYF